MANQDLFSRLVLLLEENTHNPTANECLQQIDNGEILFMPLELETSHALKIYTTRYQIQQEVTKANIMGYEGLLKNLAEEKGELVQMITFKSEGKFYALFCSLDFQRIIGILMKDDSVSLSQEKELFREYISKGLTVCSSIYYKRTPQKNE